MQVQEKGAVNRHTNTKQLEANIVCTKVRYKTFPRHRAPLFLEYCFEKDRHGSTSS